MTPHVTTGWDVLNTLAGNLPSIATAVAGGFIAWFTYKTNVQGKSNHDALNSRMSQLLKETAAASHAEGMRLGVANEQARAPDPKKQPTADDRIGEVIRP